MDLIVMFVGVVFWLTILLLWLVVVRRLRFSRRVCWVGVVILAVLPAFCALSLAHYVLLDESLLCAAMDGNAPRVRLLLSFTANPNTEFDSGFIPLEEAARGGHTDIVRLLLVHGARVNVKNHWTGCTPLKAARMNGHADIVRLLEKAGANE